jgi:hypothetical protein
MFAKDGTVDTNTADIAKASQDYGLGKHGAVPDATGAIDPSGTVEHAMKGVKSQIDDLPSKPTRFVMELVHGTDATPVRSTATFASDLTSKLQSAEGFVNTLDVPNKAEIIDAFRNFAAPAGNFHDTNLLHMRMIDEALQGLDGLNQA